jgi:sugar/nucleoside kinase (ribokinase family)
MKALVVGSSDIDIFVSPESDGSYVEDQETVAFRLGDKIPINVGDFALGGNGANVSVGLRRLGIDSSFYTYFGTDILSRQIKEKIEEEKVDIIDHETIGKNSSLSLIFDFKKDRVIFSHHEVLDYTFDISKASGFSAIYLTSIGKNWEGAYKSVLSLIQENPIICAFSPGSHQLADLNDTTYEIIAASKILFCNKQEGEKILDKKGEEANDMKELLEKLSKLGPEIVSVTNGKEGSYFFQDGVYYTISSFEENSQGTDKTGAGDSYASAFFGAHLLGKDIKTSMRWGAANANSVMKKTGAQAGLLDVSGIEKVLFDRPDFQPEML